MSKENEKPQIDYPISWGYKLIGSDKNQLAQAAEEVLKDKSFSKKEGGTSSKGKFSSISISVDVNSEKERNDFFTSFSKHPHIKFVL
ncbi:MAG: DUF493 domain-containing protein [Planctomycetes bacterium]|nr:DUF493 domain-containing protein [Planctomycetota bacterium]